MNKTENLPKHIAIVMDGNGRWAEKRGLQRVDGHKKGEEVFRKTCKLAVDKGVKYLTVFAFSTENWKRPQNEVNAIMKILKAFFDSCSDMAFANDYKIRVIGDRTVLNKDLLTAIEFAENNTINNSRLVVCIAINYGGRNEIVRAVNSWLASKQDTKEFTEKNLTDNLDTSEIPYPDLIIRTGGEIRLSNFMLWQVAYSELYFSNVLWPDFDDNEFDNAIKYYMNKKRNFGSI